MYYTLGVHLDDPFKSFENGSDAMISSSPPYTHPATYSPFKYLLVPEHRSTQSLNSLFYCTPQAFLLQTWNILLGHYRPEEPPSMVAIVTVLSGETAQPGDQTTDSGIVMPQCYQSSYGVNSMAE